MKKNLLLLTALYLMAPVFGQFGIQGGVTLKSSKISDNSVSANAESMAGFAGGIYYRHPFAGKFAVQPEFNLIQKGGDFSEEGQKVIFDLYYLELPVYFLYTGSKTSGLYGGIGPSFNIGLVGTAKEKIEEETYYTGLDFGNEKHDEIKGFHMGINFLVGYQMDGGLHFSGFVSPSITNSVPGDMQDGDDAKWSFMNYGLRVGYTIGSKNVSK